MQIEIDFEVFKQLTSLRESEADSYNAVVRRLLRLDPSDDDRKPPATVDVEKLLAARPKGMTSRIMGSLQPNGSESSPYKNYIGQVLQTVEGGVWLSNVYFPEGSKFRATYKGHTYFAEIKGGRWVDQDGVPRKSPSDAATAITRTNVNGWRFWLVQLPGDPAWRRLDELK